MTEATGLLAILLLLFGTFLHRSSDADARFLSLLPLYFGIVLVVDFLRRFVKDSASEEGRGDS